MNHHDQAVGTALGASLGLIKSFTIMTMITWEAALDTAILASIGAAAGLTVSSGLRWAKSKIRKS